MSRGEFVRLLIKKMFGVDMDNTDNFTGCYLLNCPLGCDSCGECPNYKFWDKEIDE